MHAKYDQVYPTGFTDVDCMLAQLSVGFCYLYGESQNPVNPVEM
jgi:hypothetical protein